MLGQVIKRSKIFCKHRNGIRCVHLMITNENEISNEWRLHSFQDDPRRQGIRIRVRKERERMKKKIRKKN